MAWSDAARRAAALARKRRHDPFDVDHPSHKAAMLEALKPSIRFSHVQHKVLKKGLGLKAAKAGAKSYGATGSKVTSPYEPRTLAREKKARGKKSMTRRLQNFRNNRSY